MDGWRLLRLASVKQFIAILVFAGGLVTAGFLPAQTAMSASELRSQLETIAATANGRVGYSAELLETKERITFHGDEHFPMQSVYKLPIAIAVLVQVDAGVLKLEQRVAVTTNDFVSPLQHSPIRDAHPAGTELSLSNLIYYAVSESDGTASDVCLRLIGGTASAGGILQDLGMTNVMIATTEKEIGIDEMAQYKDWTTPQAVTDLLGKLQDGHGLSESSRDFLLGLMTGTSTGPKRLKGLLPAGTSVAHKTGSSRTVNKLTRATNDVGIIKLPDGRHVAIAVFVSDSTADDETRDAVIAKMCRVTWDYWTNHAR